MFVQVPPKSVVFQMPVPPGKPLLPIGPTAA
jgi:hypothetical protein